MTMDGWNKPNSLIVGSTSQLSNYFPNYYDRISSRECFDDIKNKYWDTVYLCFGDNKTYLSDSRDSAVVNSFYKINYELTMKAVDIFTPLARRVVVYSTAELWNECSGAVNVETPFRFSPSYYTVSKYNLSVRLKDKKEYPNVSVIYPFNFNGVNRKGDFLFGKVFDSILNNKHIVLGDTYYYRDLSHPSLLARESRMSWSDVGKDFVVGSGRVVFVNDLIRSLYSEFDMKYDDYVEEKISSHAHYRTHIYYSNNSNYSLNEPSLLQILVEELKAVK